MKYFRGSVLLFLIAVLAAVSQSPQQQPYSWKSVQIVGGGFVDGVIFHPTAPGVRYARTDIGGAYRWNATGHRWQSILDWVSYNDRNLMGIESIAVDPADPNRVYLACGTYTNSHTPDGAILRSEDGGQTFQRINVPFKFGGNEDGRGNGERLAVDPGDGRILYLGTRYDGLWRSQDRGLSWMRVTSFPEVGEPVPPMPVPVLGETPEEHWQRMPARSSGIVFIKFGPPEPRATAGQSSPTPIIYAGVSLMNRPNLFISTDAGASWRPIAGEPTEYRPTRAALSSDGFFYIAYGTAPGPSRMADGAVWKLDTRTGAWTDITPDRPAAGSREFGYAAVSVDAQQPRTLIVSTFGRPGGDNIFRSTDGGASWKPIFAGGGGLFDYRLAPYVKSTPIHWLFDIEIDPTDSAHAVFTTGYGGWETFDLTAVDRNKPTHWSVLALGIEETVALGVYSPAHGARLVTAIGDYGGFVHWNLDAPARVGSSAPPRMSNTTGITSATLQPRTLVRVGISAEHRSGEAIAYSLDGGRTWESTAAAPTRTSRAGSIAVSADGASWVWTPEREAAYATRDRGTTWTVAQGLPVNLPAIADPIDPHSFYAIALASLTLYCSRNDGSSFTAHRFTLADDPPTAHSTPRGDDRGGQDHIYAAPGRSGDLWLAAFDGLYRLTSPMRQGAGSTIAFARLPGVEEIEAFGFGKAAPHHIYPALYLAGTVHGQSGIFRSIDEAHTWSRINDDQHQWGLVLQITGDPRRYGRVYVGTHGRGVLYGEPIRR